MPRNFDVPALFAAITRAFNPPVKAKRVCCMAYRCGFEAARFVPGESLASQVQTLVQRESERDDALEDVGECFCASCLWIGNQEDCETHTPKHGRGFGHTPDDVELRCPKCGSVAEEIS